MTILAGVLSGSTNGRPIYLGTGETTIHTAQCGGSGQGYFDEVTILAANTDSSQRTVTLYYGNSVGTELLVNYPIAANSGLTLLVDGCRLSGGGVITAKSDASDVVAITGGYGTSKATTGGGINGGVLSGSTNGMPILLGNTATPLHTAVATGTGAGDWDDVVLVGSNIDTSSQQITIYWGGSTGTEFIKNYTLAATSGLVILAAAKINAGLTISGLAGNANKVCVVGRYNTTKV